MWVEYLEQCKCRNVITATITDNYPIISQHQLCSLGYSHSNNLTGFFIRSQHREQCTDGHLYLWIHYPRFELSVVYRGPKKKIGKFKEINFYNFQNARQARRGLNVVKSSCPNAPNT